jgi:glycosyltransferase involved in cell wall biosynthesis
MTVSLVLPCYHPPEGWEQLVSSSFHSFCNSLQHPAELLVVFDGSSSGVSVKALSYLKIIQYPNNRGKGYAIRQGVAEAAGDIIIYTDIDFPYSIESMSAIYKTLKDNECDVAVGVKDADYYSHVPLLRRIISKYLRALIRLFLSMPITDTQCGLKGFNRSVAPLFLQTTIDRYLFDLEFIRNCFRSKKYRVKAISVSLNENIHFRSMNYRILLSESLNFIRLITSKS